MTATRVQGHCVLRKYVITVVAMAELAISDRFVQIALRIVLDQSLPAFVLREKSDDKLGNKCYNNGACSNVTGNARVLWMEKSMQTVVKTSRTQHAPQVLAVLENASTRHIVSAMLGLLESIAIPGFVQRIAIGMNSNHKANVFTTKKVQ